MSSMLRITLRVVCIYISIFVVDIDLTGFFFYTASFWRDINRYLHFVVFLHIHIEYVEIVAGGNMKNQIYL